MSRLRFDQNLSPRLVSRLADIYPDSSHVELLGLGRAFDIEVWTYVRQHESMIDTKDAEFGELLLLYGFPPKVVWIRRDNCSTQEIEDLLRDRFEAIEVLSDDPNTGILALY